MDNIAIAAILSFVEGITEFLPVSSTGHMIIVGDFLQFTGAKASTFEVVIQLGAILSIVILYWQRFWGLLFPSKNIPFSGFRGLWLLLLTTIPASIMGLLLHSFIKDHLFQSLTVIVALVVGAVCMILVERFAVRQTTLACSVDEMTPRMALGIGCFQCLALCPGFSRSAATIMGGMLLGASRNLAAEYSFIAAVPIMVAATGYELLKNYDLFALEDLPFMLVGFAGAFLSALLAVKTFVHLIGNRVTLVPFALYRLLLAPVLWYLLFW